MKLVISRDTLIEPLQAVANVVERRQTLPILANVLIQAEGEQVIFTATDMEVEVQIGIAHQALATGEATLPARKLVDICRALPPDATVELETKGEKAIIRSGRSRFSLATLGVEEFPALGVIDAALGFDIAPQSLCTLLERTQFAMAHQDVRYYLNGLLLEIEADRVKAVATDGHRLALYELPAATGVDQVRQVIIPRKAVTELSKLLNEKEETVNVAINDNHVQVTADSLRFTSKLIDGRFPDYQRVLPKGADKLVEADRESLRQGLARTSILSNEKFRGVRVSLGKDILRALAHNPEQEEAEEEIEVTYDGPEVEIGFNVSYLLDVLGVLKTDSVELHLSDPSSSCLITGKGDEHGRYVVMPMRL